MKTKQMMSGAVLMLAAATVPAHAGTLREDFEAAWQRSVAAAVSAARVAEAAAGHEVAATLFAGPPTIGLAQRSDRIGERRGLREWEAELSVPLWLPGQKAAQQAVADAFAEDSDAARSSARLAIAGEVREAGWAWRAAREEAALAAAQVAAAVRLEDDVARRVAAGDLAHADLLLARQETLSARRALVGAEARSAKAQSHYGVLTGSEQTPVDAEEIVLAPHPVHPRLQAAESAVTQARAALGLTRATSREAPSIGVQWTRERPESGAASEDTLRIGVSLPLASAPQNRARLAAANTELIRAEAERRRLADELTSEQRVASQALARAEEAAALAVRHAEAAGERLRLLERAFALGELPLSELLRARTAEFEARAESTLRHVAVLAARAALNQARGILP